MASTKRDVWNRAMTSRLSDGGVHPGAYGHTGRAERMLFWEYTLCNIGRSSELFMIWDLILAALQKPWDLEMNISRDMWTEIMEGCTSFDLDGDGGRRGAGPLSGLGFVWMFDIIWEESNETI